MENCCNGNTAKTVWLFCEGQFKCEKNGFTRIGKVMAAIEAEYATPKPVPTKKQHKAHENRSENFQTC